MYLLLYRLFYNDLRQFLSLVDQVAVVDPAIMETKKGRNRRSRLQPDQLDKTCHGHRNHFCNLHTGCNEVAHYTLPLFRCFSRFCSRGIGKAQLDHKSRLLVSNGRLSPVPVCGLQLPYHPPLVRTVFFPVSAFPGIARIFATEHAICVRRNSRNERGLVFSQSRAKLSHTTKQKERSRFHVQARPAFRDCTDFTCPDLFPNRPNLGHFSEAWRQHCEGKQVDLTHC